MSSILTFHRMGLSINTVSCKFVMVRGIIFMIGKFQRVLVYPVYIYTNVNIVSIVTARMIMMFCITHLYRYIIPAFLCRGGKPLLG